MPPAADGRAGELGWAPSGHDDVPHFKELSDDDLDWISVQSRNNDPEHGRRSDRREVDDPRADP
jgi:hypothetical protein